MSERDPKRSVVVVLSLLATLAGLGGALLLGSWGFDVRRYVQHEGRLQRLLARHPQLVLVVQALEEEGSPLAASADAADAVLPVTRRYAGRKSQEVLQKARAFPHLRVFEAADMIYFIYFDETGTMRDFTCVSR